MWRHRPAPLRQTPRQIRVWSRVAPGPIAALRALGCCSRLFAPAGRRRLAPAPGGAARPGAICASVTRTKAAPTLIIGRLLAGFCRLRVAFGTPPACESMYGTRGGEHETGR